MCGIAGIISCDAQELSQQRLHLMSAAIAYRGPDGTGSWLDNDRCAGLAHCRLSIIDLSAAGNQPMHFRRGEQVYSIIHNGEIYNHVELREELKKKGYSFLSKTDTEVILAAFDLWKENCLTRFDGMFAFAIWDHKRKELFAARDRFGEKPFYYAWHGRAFLFASEMKALWAAGLPRVPNRNMLFNFLTIGYTGNPERPGETFFTNIHKLPAANWLRYRPEGNQIDITTYWAIDGRPQVPVPSERQARQKFLELLTASVDRRLRSDVPFGTSLSGGLDSSSIAALSATRQSYKTFTAAFPGFDRDEERFALQVARKLNLKPCVVHITGSDLVEDWEKLCRHQEEPVTSSSIYAQWRVYRLAAEQNVKVLLDGQGADEVLAGYHRYYKWYWQELFLKRKLRRSREIHHARRLGVKEPFGLPNLFAALLPEIASVVLEKRYLLRALRHRDLNPEFAREHGREAYYSAPRVFDLNGALHFNCFVHGLEELLRYADRNAMAHGREVRLPFLNHELVEFLFSLPGNFKIRGGWTKWLLRTAMEPFLPHEIVWRQQKIGFEPPQESWMRHPRVQEMIRAAKQMLVDERILQASVMGREIVPRSAHEAGNYDWRYLSAASLFK